MMEKFNFINGIATIKQGRKIVAKFFDRDVFFKNTKINYSKKYCLELPKFGVSTESNDLNELINLLKKYI